MLHQLKYICLVLGVLAILIIYLHTYHISKVNIYAYTECLTVEELKADKFGMNKFKLPNLTRLEWPEIKYSAFPAGELSMDGKTIKLAPPFEPLLNKEQRNVLFELLEIFTDEMNKNGFGDQFFLLGGTLLGSLRHHDIIPYDDDVDLLIANSTRQSITDIMKKYSQEYTLYSQSLRLKFFKNSVSKKTSPYGWKWPYLDISFYTVNKTHVTELAESYGRKYVWPNNWIFPLLYRPFGVQWYPAPRWSHTFIHDFYDKTDSCVINGYSHIVEGSNKNRGNVPCAKLQQKYAFVEYDIKMKTNSLSIHRETLRVLENHIVKKFHTMCFATEDPKVILNPKNTNLDQTHLFD